MFVFPKVLLVFVVISRVGRIGAINTIRVQIRKDEVLCLMSYPINESKITRFTWETFHAYNAVAVKCVDEDGQNHDMLQFHVPQSLEHLFPSEQAAAFEGIIFTVEHACPFAQPLNAGSRPPIEENWHDPWNKAACYKQK